jgi:hypothetical protein
MYRKFKNRLCFRANLLPNEARKRSGTKLKRNDVRTGLGEVNQCSGSDDDPDQQEPVRKMCTLIR